MKVDKDFRRRQANWNDVFYPFCCLILAGILTALAAAYFWSQHPDVPTLNGDYLIFSCVALGGVAVSYLLDLCLRRRENLRRGARFAAMAALLLWASLFSAVELRQGHAIHAFPQVVVLLSAGFRLSTRLHCGINAAAFAVVAAILALAADNPDTLYSEIADNAIFLIISCGIVVVSNRIQYAAYRADKERAALRNAQLDAMAEQAGKVQDILEQSRILRHDMRHYAKEVERGLDRGEYEAIRELTRHLCGRLDQLAAKRPIRSFTGQDKVDAVINSYLDWAKQEGVRFEAELPPPPKGMEIQDFSLLLMNALENACHAAAEQPDGSERYIKLTGTSYPGQYYLQLINSCVPGAAVFDFSTGLPFSGRPGHGYGVRSMSGILERYGAYYRFQAEGAEFRFQMIVPTGEATVPKDM